MYQRLTAEEKSRLQQRYTVQATSKPVASFELYYGANRIAWFGPAPYAHCKAEENRLMESGNNYKREYFKIK